MAFACSTDEGAWHLKRSIFWQHRMQSGVGYSSQHELEPILKACLGEAYDAGAHVQRLPWHLSSYTHEWVAADCPPHLTQAELPGFWLPPSQNPKHVADGLELPAKLQTRMVSMVMSRYESELTARNQKVMEQQAIREHRRQVLHNMRNYRHDLQERSGQAKF